MTNTIDRILLPLGLGALLLTAACSSSSDDDVAPPAQQNISESLEGQGLITLLAALTQTGLLDDLGQGSLTLFAPTDEAFDQLPAGLLAGLTDQELTDLLLYHVVNTGAVPSQTAVTLDGATMANGDDVLLDVVAGELYVNEAQVTQADIQASNGIIHIIDRVLLPPRTIAQTLALRGDFGTLLGLLAGLGEAEGAFDTGLAPTDAAFAALPPGFLDSLTDDEVIELLSYHVIPGQFVISDAVMQELLPSSIGSNVVFALTDQGPTVNDAPISLFNIPATDGVLYVLDAVLTPPSTITQTAVDLEGFTTLVTALQAAGLDGVFDDAQAGPFTVFAPTNEAFDALPAGVLDTLLEPANQALLIQLLQYHVAPEVLTANGVIASVPDGITTLEGSTLTVAVVGDSVTVDDATVVVPNVLASNGIIHAIDAVLVPPDFMVAE